MTHFTIDINTNITAHATAAEAKALEGADRFSSEGALVKLAADWPAARLVEIYNSLTGVSPVKKFKDRSTAAARIWTAIQNLGQSAPMDHSQGAERQPEASDGAPAAETALTAEPGPEPATLAKEAQQTPDAAPVEAPLKKAARAMKAPVATEAPEPTGARAGSKTETVLAWMKQPKTTIAEKTRLWEVHNSVV